MCSIIVHTVSCCQKPGFAFADHTHVGMFGARGAAIQVIHARDRVYRQQDYIASQTRK